MTSRWGGEEYGLVLYYVREGMLTFGFLLYAAFAQWRKAHPMSATVTDVSDLALQELFGVL